MLSGKVMKILLIAREIKKMSYRKNKIKFELDLTNNLTKSNLQEGTGIDTTVFAKKTYLDNLRLDVDRLDN